MPALLSALSLDDFALFARVAELRNLSAVARERDAPPSQVSRALARIEQQCGARLVHRTTHGLSLTEEGDIVAAHGALLLQHAQSLGAELEQRRGDPSGLVKVATSAVFAQYVLPAVGALMQQHPRLRVEVGADDRMVDMAREGIDIAIRTGSPSGEGLVARSIGQHSRGLYAAPSYLQRRGAPEHPDALAKHTLIANSSSPMLNRWRFMVDGQPRELKVSGELRTDNTATMLAMALHGLGVARINQVIAAPHVASGALLPVLEDFLLRETTPIYAVMLPDRQRLPKVRVCVDAFAAWFARPPQLQAPLHD